MNGIEEYYNCQYDEWGRLERHRIEFEITKRVLDEFIAGGSEVLDAGGGPGRYSIYLAGKGHRVILLDLCERLVEQAAENAGKAGVEIQQFIRGNVLELHSLLPGRIFDVVLCMGPMYHLLEERERKEALGQCLKVLKPGGTIIISFISAYAPMVDCLKAYPHKIRARKEHFLRYLDDGRSNHEEDGFTDAYFTNPESIESLVSGFGLETLRIMAVEGLGAACEGSLMQLPEEDFQAWLDLFYAISANRVIWGSGAHLLYIGRKKGEES